MRCFLKRPVQRQVQESGCHGDGHVPSSFSAALPFRLFVLWSIRLRGPGSRTSPGKKLQQEGSENKFPEEKAD